MCVSAFYECTNMCVRVCMYVRVCAYTHMYQYTCHMYGWNGENKHYEGYKTWFSMICNKQGHNIHNNYVIG